MKNILVSDIMTREPLTIKPNTTLLECARKMIKNRRRSFPIVEKKKLKGFIAQRDILWAFVKKPKQDFKKIKVIEVSPKKISTIRPNATIKEAFEKMKKSRFEKFPVIKNGEFVGLLTLRDILNFNPEFYPELEEMSKIKEESEKLKRVKRIKQRVSEGICEECGHQDLLYRFNGMLICESCMER